MQIYVPLLLVNAADDPLVHESLLSIPRALSGTLKQSAPAGHICVPAASLSHHDPWFQSSLTCLLTSVILWEVCWASLNHQLVELTRLTLSRKNLSPFRHLLLFWLGLIASRLHSGYSLECKNASSCLHSSLGFSRKEDYYSDSLDQVQMNSPLWWWRGRGGRAQVWLCYLVLN